MGRIGTHLTDLSAGWGPSGRRFKSGLPDNRKLAWKRDSRSPLTRSWAASPGWYHGWYRRAAMAPERKKRWQWA